MTTIPSSICKQHPNFRSTFIALATLVSVQCTMKQLLDEVFVISRIIEVSVRVISLSLRPRLITPTSTSIILDITKTSSDNAAIAAN